MPKKKIAKKPDKARQHLTESERRASSLSFVTVDPKKRKRPFTPSEPSDEEIKKRTRKYHKEGVKKTAKNKPKKTEFQKRREIISGAAGSGLSISARQKYLLTGDLPKKRKRDKKE